MAENYAVVFPDEREVVLEDREIPDPGPDEVLVETERSLISTGTELSNLTGIDDRYVTSEEYAPDFPFTPGYCNIGTVTEVGEELAADLVGTRVASYGSHAKYVTAAAPAPGTSQFRTYRPVPEAVDRDEASFFTIAEIVMNGIRKGRVAWGESVAVFGLGLLGQLAVRLACFAGATPVVGLDLAADRRGYLPDRSRIHAMDPTDDGFEDEIDERLPDGNADVVFELTGRPDVIPDELELLRDQGRFVVLGSPRGSVEFDFLQHCHRPGFELIGAHNRTHPSETTRATPWTQERHADLFFELLRTDDLRTSELVTHRYDAQDAPEAYEMLLEDRTQALGVVFEW